MALIVQPRKFHFLNLIERNSIGFCRAGYSSVWKKCIITIQYSRLDSGLSYTILVKWRSMILWEAIFEAYLMFLDTIRLQTIVYEDTKFNDDYININIIQIRCITMVSYKINDYLIFISQNKKFLIAFWKISANF